MTKRTDALFAALEDAASAAMTQAHSAGKFAHMPGIHMASVKTAGGLAQAIVALKQGVAAEVARTTRNRDMWKGQCERQAAELERLRRGEYLCNRCGLRKDADADGAAPF